MKKPLDHLKTNDALYSLKDKYENDKRQLLKKINSELILLMKLQDILLADLEKKSE